MRPYNFDVVQGASYRIDPTAPAGRRVRELRYRGREVRDEDVFTLAVNSYRAQGSGGYAALGEPGSSGPTTTRCASFSSTGSGAPGRSIR
jgi:5''-nucleotidase, C-terminal domain.